MPKSLKNFIFSINVILISALFVVVFVFTTYLHTSLTEKNAIKHSHAVSNQVFSSMYQVMKRGWSRDELNDFLSSLKSNFDDSNYKINIYRSDLVAQLFGSVHENKHDEMIQNVFATGVDKTINNNGVLRDILPLHAKNECLRCHINAKVGDTLGVIEVKQNLDNIVHETFMEYIYFFFIIIPMFVLIAYVASRYTTSKINNALKLFDLKVQGINSISDFKQFDPTDINLQFKEVNDIIENVNILAQKLKAIAVDKDLLEFEVQLLDKFIITSDIVKDWRNYIKELLVDINKVMPTYTLMTIFRVGDDQFEVDIFWYGIPQQEVKELFEDYIRDVHANDHHFFNNTDYCVFHNIAEHTIDIDRDLYEKFAHRTKTLFLETPRIGGIVGLSVQSEVAVDPVKYIVMDSILTTMANLVGSVKAINKYTNDLEYYAAHDGLTGLFNQRIFLDLLEYEIKRAGRHGYSFVLLMIDCDNFKPINDLYGHAFGDLFLQEFAKLLETHKRDEDILSRYGGDEFTIILPESDLAGAMVVINKIIAAVQEFKIPSPDGKFVGVTASVGVAIYPDHGNTVKELFTIADSMMYLVKDEGKNGYKVPSEEEILNIIKDRKEKSGLLMDAVTNNRIIPYFQPIRTTTTGKTEIHELLMRIEIDGEIIPAYKFIEAAESMSIINRMDLMVIENAFKKMNEENYEGVLFINLSPKSLIVGNYTESVTSLIKQYNISKERIVFEITERETVKNFSILEKFVLNLKFAGYKFAIDDFGSGFSSFHYIKNFPIDYLKIDGEFIININKDPKDKAFVHSILTLAHELNIKTVAEYVEDEEIVTTLQEMGVDYLQGFHIGKPQNSFAAV